MGIGECSDAQKPDSLLAATKEDLLSTIACGDSGGHNDIVSLGVFLKIWDPHNGGLPFVFLYRPSWGPLFCECAFAKGQRASSTQSSCGRTIK